MTVVFLIVLETAHAATAVWSMDHYLIAQYGNVSALESGTWSFAMTYLLGLAIDFHVCLYFTWRIWLSMKIKWIVILLCALCASRTGFAIHGSLLTALQPTWSVYLRDYGSYLVVIDCRTWLHDNPLCRPLRIDTVLNRLSMFAVATGVLTSFVDLIIVILLFWQPHGLAFMSAVLVRTHLYSNSVLASLNIRKAIVPHDPSTVDIDIEFPAVASLRFADFSSISGTTSELPEPGVRQRGGGRGELGRGDANDLPLSGC